MNLLTILGALILTPASSLIPPTALALDGDTIRIHGQLDIRLAGIDAPELPGHCTRARRGRGHCAPGNPFEAKRALQAMLRLQCPCTFQPAPTRDYYGRRLGWVIGKSGSLNAAMLREGYAAEYER